MRLRPGLILILLLPFAACDRNGGSDDTDAVQDSADSGDEVVEDVQVDADSDADDGDAVVDDAAPDLPVCEPGLPTARAELPPGAEDEGAVLGLGGRGLATPGATLEIRGFPSNGVISSDGAFAYVVASSRGRRNVTVVDLVDASLVQEVPLPDVFYGIALDPDEARLHVSGGATRSIFTFDRDAGDGTLRTDSIETSVPGYTSGLALTPDGQRIFVGSFSSGLVFELDATALGTADAVTAQHAVGAEVWDVEYLASSDRIVASTLHRDTVSIFDLAEQELNEIVVGRSPMGLAVSDDEQTAWVAVSDADALVELDLAAGEERRRSHVVAEDGFRDADGEPLRRSNPNDVAVSPDGARLLVSRGADNAVTVFDADTLSPEGSFPTSWYPTGTGFDADGSRVVVYEGRGFGSGPDTDPSTRDTLDGNVVVVDWTEIDLDATTADVERHFNRANEVFPFECDGFFPIPTRPGARSPIEHVILIVKENKTFDCVFGDLEDMDVDVDPTLVRWGEEITPNQHAIAREFTISDNFHVESENSDMGHLVLTTGFLTDFMERVWVEAKRHGGDFLGYQLEDAGVHETGNIFTHLMDHGVDIRVYGEIVGMFARAADGRQPMQFTDPDYPGGIFYNMNARDSARAEYVLERIDDGDFASFTFMLLPNDHTGGTAPGNPTPESEVADNDEAVGILIDGLSRSEHWESTAVFVVEDDPQGCSDHVDSHRSFLLVASPWARRGYVSHVNASFQSVFATIFRILGVPPMGRPDASAAPLWDMFVGAPDLTPFEARPRLVPEEKILDLDTPGAEESMRMDFRGPDRNQDLGAVLDAYRLWRMGVIDRDEAHQRIRDGVRSEPELGWADPDELEEMFEELEEEAEEEVNAYDQAFEEYRLWLAERGRQMPEIPGAPIPEDVIRGVMSGAIPIEEATRVVRPPRVHALPTPARGGR